eukprot:3018665-Amphidinium_carterae.1
MAGTARFLQEVALTLSLGWILTGCWRALGHGWDDPTISKSRHNPHVWPRTLSMHLGPEVWMGWLLLWVKDDAWTWLGWDGRFDVARTEVFWGGHGCWLQCSMDRPT